MYNHQRYFFAYLKLILTGWKLLMLRAARIPKFFEILQTTLGNAFELVLFKFLHFNFFYFVLGLAFGNKPTEVLALGRK